MGYCCGHGLCGDVHRMVETRLFFLDSSLFFSSLHTICWHIIYVILTTTYFLQYLPPFPFDTNNEAAFFLQSKEK